MSFILIKAPSLEVIIISCICAGVVMEVLPLPINWH